MSNKYILDKLIDALNSFSDSHLRQLAALFAQPNVGETLVKLIDSTLVLREAERRSKSGFQDKPTREAKYRTEGFVKKDQPVANNNIKVSAMNELKNTFVTSLNDRKLFPSTKDVVKVVNESLGCNIRYAEFYRRGRTALIKKCMNHLASFPKQKQVNMLKFFFSKIEEKPAGMEPYQRLFKILAGDE